MNHQWRPRPVQGNNICPICSTTHFPFCPPVPNPGYPLGDPNFNPQFNMQQPVYPIVGEHYRDPLYLNGNPTLPIDTFRNQYQFRPTFPGDPGSSNFAAIYPEQSFNHGGNLTGNEHNNVDVRSTKRLRVDGPNPVSYASEVYGNSSRVLPNENERRLKLIRDHGNTGDVRQDGSYGGIPGNKFKNDVYQYGPAANSTNGYQPIPYPSNGFLGEKSFNGFQHSAPEYDLHANLPLEKGSLYDQPARPSAPGHLDHMKYGYQGRPGYQNYTVGPQYGRPEIEQGNFDNSIRPGYYIRPPLPNSPPPPLPPNPPASSAPTRISPSLFPIQDSPSASLFTSYHLASGANSLGQQCQQNSQAIYDSRCLFPPDSPSPLASGAGQPFMTGRNFSEPFTTGRNFSDTPKVIDISHLFKQPHRATRPDHFVIILRGLPGSGKSYLAKMLRDLEVEHGGSAPRIHSMDDYFMTEVEKVEYNEASKPSGRGKKAVTKTVLEYCYEPEMEEAYRSYMLKAFRKTLEEGAFTFVIVDDRNLRVADFAQFWATAKRLGYEVYLLEAPYKDPSGCTARNVHNFAKDDIEKMAKQWEVAPSLYLQVDVKSLFHGDDLKAGNIEEVDMDMEEDDVGKGSSELNEKKYEKLDLTVVEEHGSPNGEKKWKVEVDYPPEEARVLGHSKWSSNDGDDDDDTETEKRKQNAFSGLYKAYGKEGKSVHWGDQAASVGFSIGAVKRADAASLVIGPGAGYNVKSNPLMDDMARLSLAQETKKHSVFQDRLRAERESFRAVFDRRKHRIGGFWEEDE